MKDIPIPQGWLGLGLLVGGVAFIYFAFHKPAQAASTSAKMATQNRPPGGLAGVGGPQVGVESPPEGYNPQPSPNDSTNVTAGYTSPSPQATKYTAANPDPLAGTYPYAGDPGTSTITPDATGGNIPGVPAGGVTAY